MFISVIDYVVIMAKKTLEQYFNDHTFIKWVSKKHWFNLWYPFSKKTLFVWSIISLPIIIFLLYMYAFSFQSSYRYEGLWFVVWPGYFFISSFIKLIAQNKFKK